MNRMRALLVGAALATVAAVAPAAQASASTASPMGAPERCASGYFCAYTQTNGNGAICSYGGDAPDMGSCSNQEGSVYNNGVYVAGYSNVAMYFKPGKAGCWAALGLGDYYLDLHQNTFNHGTGGNANGCGQSLWHNIASMRWY